MTAADNPDGPLTPGKTRQTKKALEQDRSSYFDSFTRAFFRPMMRCTSPSRSAPLPSPGAASQRGTTGFREDLKKVVPVKGPIGCSGSFLATKAVYELSRIGGRDAPVTMCIGRGQGIAEAFARL